MACLTPSELWTESNKMWNMWSKSQAIENWELKSDTGAFKRMFEASTGKLFESGERIEPVDLRKMQVAIKDLEHNLKNPGALSNKFLKSFYVGTAKAMRNPFTERFFQSLVNANEYRNSHTANMMGSFHTMTSKLKLAILEHDKINVKQIGDVGSGGTIGKRDILAPSNIKKKRLAGKKIKELERLESLWTAERGAGGNAVKEYGHLMKFLKGEEGRMFQDFQELITAENNSLLVEKYKGTELDSRISPYVNTITDAVSSWRGIQTEAKGHLMKSISNIQETLKYKYGPESKTAKRLIEEYEGIKLGLEKHKGGYVPHFVLDLLGHSLELRDRMSTAKHNEGDNILLDYVNKTRDLNTQLTKRLAPKTNPDAPQNEYFSRNPLLYAEKYISQVVQFNHGSFVDMHYADNLNRITATIFKNPTSQEANAAKVYQKILTDLYGKSNNLERVDSPHANNITRLLTSMQFVAKLGWSTRGALRNATQSLLNLNHFGYAMTYDAMTAYKHSDYKNAMEKELDRHGLQFLDISQVTEGAISNTDLLARGVKFDPKGYITKKERGAVLEMLTEKGVKLADASSIFTKFIENKNRKLTFKIGFHKRVEQLKRLEKYSSWGENKELADRMYVQAGNFAAKATSLLHFEYARFGKSDILNHPLGAILGQFGHYGMSYANWNTQMIKDYKRAFKAGDYRGEELGRIVKLGLLHGMTEMISAMAGIDFTSYINHDTADRVMNLTKFLAGDEDESLKAFHGKGLVGASGLVPVSDLVEIHNLGAAAGYWNMLADEDSTAAWLLGMRKYDKIDGKEFGGEIAGMMSIEGERLIKNTIPSMGWRNGNMLTNMWTAELGLYPGGTTAMGIKTRDARKEWLKVVNPKPKKKRKHKRGDLIYDVNRRGRKIGGLTEDQRRDALYSLADLG